jgi:outer membrane protein insertion porin family
LKTARVKPVGLPEKADTVDFLVEVEEKKPYAIEASVGYDTSRRLYVSTRLSDLNLLGRNKEVWIELEGSQIGNRGELGITEPRLLNTRIAASGNLFWEKREELNVGFGTRSYGLTTSFGRKLPYHLSANLGIRYERKEQYLRDEAVLDSDQDELYDPRGIMVVSPSLVYNSVDSFIRPRKGMYSSVGIDFSRGLENALDNFIVYRGEIRWYAMLHKRVVLALRGRAGHIVPSGEESVIPEDQLFFLGGLSSVRGYGENRLRTDADGDALGGRTELVGSVEVRFDIGFNLELAPFYDIGSVKNALVDEGEDVFLASAGLSLRYMTPFLPIGLQYGHKLDKQEADEDNGRFYFSLGYTF